MLAASGKQLANTCTIGFGGQCGVPSARESCNSSRVWNSVLWVLLDTPEYYSKQNKFLKIIFWFIKRSPRGFTCDRRMGLEQYCDTLSDNMIDVFCADAFCLFNSLVARSLTLLLPKSNSPDMQVIRDGWYWI